jgi:lactoylglutathione lyase
VVIGDVFQPQDRQQCLGLGEVISSEGNRNRRTLINPDRAVASISPEAIRPQRPALADSLLLLNFPNPATISSQNIREQENMRYLHTMLRVRNLDAALKFYQDALGLKEVRRVDNDKAKFTLVFLCAAEDEGLLKASQGRGAPLVELTYNWDEEKYGEDRYFGHLAYEVDDIYATCDRLMKLGITINRPPRDGQMAFVRSPDLHSVELLQKGEAKPPAEPWTSMPNTGHW